MVRSLGLIGVVVISWLSVRGLVSTELARPLQVVLALGVGVVAPALAFMTANRLLDAAGGRLERLRSWVFVGPALGLLGFFLVFPTVRTAIISVTARPDGRGWLANYISVLTAPDTLAAFRNTAIWLVLVTAGAVVIGLVFATLADKIVHEALAKTFIFLPVAISMVGAAVIFRFVYVWQPAGQPQIGLLNAALTALGGDPVAFLQTPYLNTLALIAILVWMETGFAMVILSAAIKAVPQDLIGAAKVDGASEWAVFRHIVLPSIRGPIIAVITTTVIVALKVFDIVFVTTGGRFDSDVVANRMISELLKFRNPGRAAALATILMVATTPVIVANVRQLRSGRDDR